LCDCYNKNSSGQCRTLLNNTTPLFIPVITLLWLKIKIDEKIWWGILVGFVGIILILRPSAVGLIKEGDLYGLAAGIFLAIAYVALKILTLNSLFNFKKSSVHKCQLAFRIDHV